MTAIDDSGQSAGSAVYLSAILIVLVLVAGLFLILSQTAMQSPGELTVTELNPEHVTVDEFDSTAVSVTVENTGDSSTTEAVELSLGDRQRSTVVTVGPGESETVEFQNLGVAGFDIGTHSYDVRTKSDERSGTLTVTSDRPQLFEVTDLQPGSFSLDGEMVDVSAEILNSGGSPGTQTVALRVGNVTLVESTVSLDPGESETFRIYNARLGVLDGGEYEYGIYSANDSATGLVDIPARANLEFTAFEPGDVSVHVTDRITISGTVQNTGERVANRTIELSTADGTVATKRVELAPGAVRTVEFDGLDASDFGIGVTQYSLSTGDETVTGEVTVEGDEPARFEIDSLEPGTVYLGNRDTFDVSVTIVNTGERTGTRSVELRIDGDVRVNTSIELAPGESETIHVYNLYVGGFDRGSYLYEVRTGADRETARIHVS